MGLEGQRDLVLQTFLFWAIPPLPFVAVVAVTLGRTHLVVVFTQLGKLCKRTEGSVHHRTGGLVVHTPHNTCA